MRLQIRKNVFETNSSSTHAICISKEKYTGSLPNHITFSHGEFGWEFGEYHETEYKASYLYQAICDCNIGEDRKKKLDIIIKYLGEYGISCDFVPNKNKKIGDGYIDQAEDTLEFVNSVLSSKERLITYLFGDSFIVTGNDNSYDYYERMLVREGEISTEWGTYGKYGGLKPEFENYDVFQKGN